MQYSHSRLSTFEQCKQKFKFKYIDKTEAEIENTVEAFMGSRVHETLEKLYKELKFEKLNSLQDLLDFYHQEWGRHWTEDILIVKEELGEEHYRKTGERCIRDYYARFKPFDGAKTIGTEIRVEIHVEGRIVQGFIDRLDCQDTHYFIHDYKTSGNLPTQQSLDEDRQLALYSIAVKEMYPDAEKITLVWHYLVFDKTLTSTRTPEQLDTLRKNILEVIKEVEACNDYPTKTSRLCDWCEYRSQCPAWKHEVTVESLAPEEFKADDGVRLVDEYVRLSEEAKVSDAALEAAKLKLLSYSEQHGLSAVAGSRMRAKIWKGSNMAFPGRKDPGRQEFEELLRNLGIYEQVRAVDTWYMGDLMKEGRINPIIVQALMKKYPKKDVTKIYLGER